MVVKRRWGLAILLAVLVALLAGCDSTSSPVGETPSLPTAPLLQGTSAAPVPAPTEDPNKSFELALEQMQRYEGRVLVRVNGEEIGWDDYEPTLVRALSNVTQQYGLDWGDPAMQQRLAHFQDDILESMIDQTLLRQMAERLKIAVSEAEVEERLEAEKARVLSSGQSVQWEDFLTASGYTEEEFKQFIAERLLLEALMAAQDVETSVEHLQLSHIYVKDGELAQAIVAELKAGRDFATLAAQYSEDPSTKENGGDVGWIPRGGIDPALEDAVFALEVGQYTDALETATGWSILLVKGREWRDLVPEALQQKQTEALKDQLEAERASADIEYLVDFVTAVSGG